MAPHRRPILVVSGRHPFEVSVLLAAVMTGIFLLVTGFESRSVSAAMPGAIGVAWDLFMVGGGIIALVGAYWPGKLLARLGLEAIGVLLFGASLAMYVVSVVAFSGMQAVVAAMFVGSIAAGALLRAAQIGLDIRRVTAAVESGTTVTMPLLASEERK